MKYPQPSATALWLIRNLECDTVLIGMIRNHPQPDFNLSATWERLERGKLGTSYSPPVKQKSDPPKSL